MNGFKRSNGKFLVDTENVDFIIENIRAKVDDRSFAIPMERKKVTRIIYRMPYLKENESRWLRILIGDVDCHNKTGVTITYKVKNTTEGKEVKTPILKVEEFDQAVDFFEALGFQRTSTQENIRTKLLKLYYKSYNFITAFLYSVFRSLLPSLPCPQGILGLYHSSACKGACAAPASQRPRTRPSYPYYGPSLSLFQK